MREARRAMLVVREGESDGRRERGGSSYGTSARSDMTEAERASLRLYDVLCGDSYVCYNRELCVTECEVWDAHTQTIFTSKGENTVCILTPIHNKNITNIH